MPDFETFQKGKIVCTSPSCKATLKVGERRDDQIRTLDVNGWQLLEDPEFDRLMPFCRRCV